MCKMISCLNVSYGVFYRLLSYLAPLLRDRLVNAVWPLGVVMEMGTPGYMFIPCFRIPP